MRIIVYLVLSVVSACLGIAGENKKTLQQGPDLKQYKLVFEDNFDGPTLDTSIWDYRHENILVNGATFLRSNVSIENGVLRLKDNMTPDGQYGASMISTEKNQHYWYKYGYFEIRAKLSAGVGTSCAFWLQTPKVNTVSIPYNTAENGAEIDIFENGITQGNNKIFYSLHWNGYDPRFAKMVTHADEIPGIYNGYHTFALEWTSKRYTIYVDGVKRASYDSLISKTPQFIILGNGRGGFGGMGIPFPNPDFFDVDYIRVYQRKSPEP